MTYWVRHNGSFVAADKAYVRVSGEDKTIEAAWVYQNGWKQFHQDGITVLAVNSVNLIASSLFTTEQWTGPATKKIIIPNGVEIGSNDPTLPALSSGTGRGGNLILVNNGILSGAGGVANSGVGGNAFSAFETVDFINNGIVRSGGGGGGLGGDGGGGSYTSTNVQGPYYNGYPNYTGSLSYIHNVSGGRIWWQGSWLGYNGPSYTTGGWTYLPHTYAITVSGNPEYSIQRQQTITHYTSGGAGGAGGRGYGFNHTSQTGLIGSAGGTNAGGGGWGGNGGGWGASGASGSNGADGNNGAGSAGLAGGLTGFAYENPHLINLTENGTALGR